MLLSQIEYAKFVHDADFLFSSDRRAFFLLTKSRARFYTPGGSVLKEPGQMCLCLPGEEMRLTFPEKHGVFDYCEFSMDEEEKALFCSLPLPSCEPTAPPNFSELSMRLKNMYYLFFSADKYRLEKLDLDLRALMYSIASGDEDAAGDTRVEMQRHRLRQLRRLISDDPNSYRTVAEAAEFVGLSVSSFEHLYKQYFSISYVNDLIRSRIKRSCMLLNTTDWTVARIAEASGYENETFFYRQFKRQTGVSPRQYRQLNAAPL